MHLLDAWDNYHRHGDRSAVSRPCEAAESTGLGYEADRFSDGKGGVRESDENRPPRPRGRMVGLHRKFRGFIVGLVPTLGVDRGPTSPIAGRKMMRVMIKFALPVESSNTAIRTGKLQKVMQQIAEDLKPEAA